MHIYTLTMDTDNTLTIQLDSKEIRMRKNNMPNIEGGKKK